MADTASHRTGLSLAWKIFLGTAVVVVAAMGVSLVVSERSATKTARSMVDRSVAQTARTARTLLDGQEETLARTAVMFAENPVFRDVVMQARSGTIADQAREAADRVGATWVQITDAEGRRIARSDMPAAQPVSLAASPLIQAALDGQSARAYGVTGDSVLFQAVAVPITHPGGKVIGVLMAAKNITDSLANAVRAVTSNEIVFFALDSAKRARVVASTLERGVDASAPIAKFVADHLGSDAPLEQRVITVGGTEYVAREDSLRSAAGTRLGGFVALSVRALQLGGVAELRRNLALAGLLGLGLALLFSFLLARGITRPLGQLLGAARRAAAGDYHAPPEMRSGDEVGELAGAFSHLLAELRDQQALVNVLRASGDTQFAMRQRAEAAAGAPTTPSSRAIGQGTLFAGRYQILGTLGTGGMGVVYKATDTQLGETVAVKTLRADFVNNDPTALERFKSEIRLARRISHRNVVRTHDIGEFEGTYFITMEYVAGRSLHELLAKKPRLPTAAALPIGKQLCRALDVAHEQGIIHRDIKPQNLVLQPDGVLKVMDFGIARLTEGKKGVTRTGMVVGTPEYMAPEQLLGDEIDARADLYSAGVVLYECLTGSHPWEAGSTTALVGKMLSEPPRPPIELNAEVPPALSALILRVLSRDRNDRPASAAEFEAELERLG